MGKVTKVLKVAGQLAIIAFLFGLLFWVVSGGTTGFL